MYTWSDADGKHIAGPNIQGLEKIKAEVSKAEYPAFEQLLQHGYTNQLMKLGLEIKQLIKASKAPDVKTCLTELAAFAKRADEIVILET